RSPAVAAPAEGRRARPAGARRRLPARPLVWLGVLLVLGLGSWLGVRAWINHSYFVGVADGNVAIYRSLPSQIGGMRLAHVEERTGVALASVPAQFRQSLQEGIRAKNLAEARTILARVTAGATPAPGASPTPSPTPTKT